MNYAVCTSPSGLKEKPPAITGGFNYKMRRTITGYLLLSTDHSPMTTHHFTPFSAMILFSQRSIIKHMAVAAINKAKFNQK